MKITLFTITIIFLFGGCFSDKRTLFQEKITKLEDLQDIQAKPQIKEIEYEYKIVPQDRVSIQVYKQPNLSTSSEDSSDAGLKVLQDGTIRLPLIDSIKISGLTEKEASLLIENKFSKYLRKPHVDVKILNKRAYVLGEVNKPGMVAFDTDYMNIVNLIGMQGGFTDYADRTNIKIIKGDLNNPSISTIDLTNMNEIRVSKLIIKPNDIIYVQSNSSKETNLTINEYTPILQLVGNILSTFTNIKYLSE